jgi:(p)ppGpp synthase/HD superfamily hydrolase
MVDQVYEEFKHILPINLYVVSVEVNRGKWEERDDTHKIIKLASFGHDLIEDTRTSYNNVKDNLDEFGSSSVADIIYALSNEKGKTRKERANDKYYQGIRETPGAVFVKLCDRIANVQYSKMTKSRMFEMYKNENDNFMKQLGYDGSTKLLEFGMFYYLNKLFKYN